MSLRGYCRTLRERMDCKPAIRIARLMQMARTGRFTKRSVIFISVVLRLRRRIVAGLHLVVDRNSSAVAQLEHARGHNLVSWLDAGDDGDLISTRSVNFHELLPHAAIRLSVRALYIRDNEYGVAKRRVTDRGCRQWNDRAIR